MPVLNSFLGKITAEIINPIILLLSACSFLVLVWGIFEFVFHAGDATKREEGRKAIMWGIVGLVIIFGAYGIVDVALQSFGITDQNGQQMNIEGVLGP